MENLIIKPKDKAELKFFLELAKRLGTKVVTIQGYSDERLLQTMEINKKSPKIDREKILDTLHKIINE